MGWGAIELIGFMLTVGFSAAVGFSRLGTSFSERVGVRADGLARVFRCAEE